MTVNRDTARRYTTRARAASLVLLVAAGAVVALPLPMFRPVATAGAVTDLDPGTGQPAEAEKPKPQIKDLDMAISRIWELGPPPGEELVQETPDKPAPEGDKPAVAQAPAPPAGWRYIGSIMGPRGMHALMERDGRQRLVKLGDEVSGARFTAIETGQVTIEENGVPKQIKISDRASRWDSSNMASIAQSSMPGRPIPPGAANSRVGGQVPRNPATPPARPVYPVDPADEERLKYEQEKMEKYREAGEEYGAERPEDGGRR